MNYVDFLEKLDSKLEAYRTLHKKFLHCQKGCSSCCEKGDYPLSQIELKYLMQGYISLENDTKIKIQSNIKNFKKGGKCPFLINSECSVYSYRPIICRVHGLAYLCGENKVKTPYCVKKDKNYSEVYKDGKITLSNADFPIEPME